MSRRKKSQPVGQSGSEKKRSKMRIELRSSAQDQILADRRARRQDAVANGTLIQSGAGCHGGSKRQKARRNRQHGRVELRQSRYQD